MQKINFKLWIFFKVKSCKKIIRRLKNKKTKKLGVKDLLCDIVGNINFFLFMLTFSFFDLRFYWPPLLLTSPFLTYLFFDFHFFILRSCWPSLFLTSTFVDIYSCWPLIFLTLIDLKSKVKNNSFAKKLGIYKKKCLIKQPEKLKYKIINFILN